MPFKIVRNDITKMKTEAIVNTANAEAAIGTGCDYAVYQAAGPEKLLQYRKDHFGYVKEGEVFLTPGFGLPASYIIHAVSPLYHDGEQGEEELLRACYRKSLQLARERGISTISFPLISTGSFGYPMEEGMRIAVDEINAFLLGNEMMIYLVVFDTRSTRLGEKLYPDLEGYIDHNYVKEAREKEYGDAFFGTTRRPDEKGYDLYQQMYESMDRRLMERGRRQECASASASLSPSCENACDEGKEFPKDDEKAPLQSAECQADQASDFWEVHESKLDERMQHLSDTYSEYLLYLIREKNMENAEVYKRAIVDKKIFSKIKNNPFYHPNKLTALCLCVGAKLNLDESKDLLARAGYALSPCDKTDVIFSYFIENEIYDMIELDIQLEEHGLPCIITF